MVHKLQKFREDLGLTQKEIGELIGIGQNRVSKIECGVITCTKVQRRLIESLKLLFENELLEDYEKRVKYIDYRS